MRHVRTILLPGSASPPGHASTRQRASRAPAQWACICMRDTRAIHHLNARLTNHNGVVRPPPPAATPAATPATPCTPRLSPRFHTRTHAQVTPLLKPVDKCWQPTDFLPASQDADFLDKVGLDVLLGLLGGGGDGAVPGDWAGLCLDKVGLPACLPERGGGQAGLGARVVGSPGVRSPGWSSGGAGER